MTANAARVAGLLAPARDSDTPDDELVRRFVTERDEHAFAALVRRHGPMVWGVCRRVIRDEHLAEDAFQAAFVVLARRAGAISPPGAVAGWLHGVAFRVAKDARRSAMRRVSREQIGREVPEPAAHPPDSPGDDLRAVIDDELRKMPAKYRELLVACDLEGRARQPVAEALGIPEGTLSSRLTAARRTLADRLTRRGLAPAVAAAIAASGPAVEACEVPPVLLASAARIGSDAVGAVPASVVALANGAIRAMTTKKILTAGLALAALALCALGAAHAAGLFAEPPPPPEKPEPPKAAAPAPAPPKAAPAGPNRILFVRDGKLVTVDPDGKNDKVVGRGEGLFRPTEARLSPDGKRVAALIKAELPNDPRPGDPPRHRLYVRALDEKEPGTDLGVDVMTFAWSADGAKIAYTGLGKAKPGDEEGLPVVHGVVTVATKKVAPLKLPAEHLLLDWSRDGKFFVTLRAEEKSPPAMYLVNRDGTEHKALTDGKYVVANGRLSPDGKKLLYTRVVPEKRKGKEVPDSVGGIELRVLDTAAGKSVRVAEIPRGDWPTGLGLPAGLCWSPDGKRVAYAWRHITTVGEDARDVENEVQLRVCDADGKNPATLATWKVKGAVPDSWLNAIDWR